MKLCYILVLFTLITFTKTIKFNQVSQPVIMDKLLSTSTPVTTRIIELGSEQNNNNNQNSYNLNGDTQVNPENINFNNLEPAHIKRSSNNPSTNYNPATFKDYSLFSQTMTDFYKDRSFSIKDSKYTLNALNEFKKNLQQFIKNANKDYADEFKEGLEEAGTSSLKNSPIRKITYQSVINEDPNNLVTRTSDPKKEIDNFKPKI